MGKSSPSKNPPIWEIFLGKRFWFNISMHPIYITHRIHGTGIFTYIYHKNQLNVGKKTIYGSSGFFATYFTIWMPKRTIKTTLGFFTDFTRPLKTRPKKVATIRKYCMFEGRFNMLKAGVTYIKQTQVFGERVGEGYRDRKDIGCRTGL